MIRLTHDADRLPRPDGSGAPPRLRRRRDFLGTVRDLTDGKVTVALDYEAYPGMAEKKMAEIERRRAGAGRSARW